MGMDNVKLSKALGVEVDDLHQYRLYEASQACSFVEKAVDLKPRGA